MSWETMGIAMGQQKHIGRRGLCCVCMYLFISNIYDYIYSFEYVYIYKCKYWISDLYWIFTQMLVYIVDAYRFYICVVCIYLSICLYVLRNLP